VTLSTALRLGRVSNLPTVWTNTIAGVALGGAAMTMPVILGLLAATSLFYVGGMFLNDAFDAEIDAHERPERPIARAEVDVATVFKYGFILLGLATACALLAARSADASVAATLAASLSLGATIVAYDIAHKGFAPAPIIMGSCRALVYVLAAVAAGGTLDRALAVDAVVLAAYVAGLTYLAARENLREVGNLWPLVLVAAPALAALCSGASTIAIVTVVLFATWTARAIAFAAKHESRDIPGAVTRLIAGISLVDAMAVATVAGPVVVVLTMLGVPSTRLFQRTIPGT
jgi:4-hydroxybenzoate polyprenyltransferase